MKGFDDAVGMVLAFEGGLSDAAADRGGLTKFGITQTTLNNVRSAIPSLPSSVATMTASQAATVYRLAFWNPFRCQDLPWPVSLYLFDAAINHGPRNAVKMLQRAVWIDDDGVVGPETVLEANTKPVNEIGFAMLTLRRQFYANLVSADGSQQIFLKGWLARVDRLLDELGP